MNTQPIKKVFCDTLDVLERTGVECAVMGGFAVHYWGLPRPTYDVDFAVALDGDALKSLLHALSRPDSSSRPSSPPAGRTRSPGCARSP